MASWTRNKVRECSERRKEKQQGEAGGNGYQQDSLVVCSLPFDDDCTNWKELCTKNISMTTSLPSSRKKVSYFFVGAPDYHRMLESEIREVLNASRELLIREQDQVHQGGREGEKGGGGGNGEWYAGEREGDDRVIGIRRQVRQRDHRGGKSSCSASSASHTHTRKGACHGHRNGTERAAGQARWSTTSSSLVHRIGEAARAGDPQDQKFPAGGPAGTIR
eukprot:753071-Hanusia_phi.AAC.1